MNSFEHPNYLSELDDDHFDLIYPLEIRDLSSIHWTPVSIARKAAKFLVNKPGTRVLDIGCGPGKFCTVGALVTEGQFTGVEQREHLCDLARLTIGKAKISNVKIIHANITQIDFSNYDAFYLFNPFEENLFAMGLIDEIVVRSDALFEEYTVYVTNQLARAPVGTRLVTYCGCPADVPNGYECQRSSIEYSLTFWEKTSHHPLEENRPE
ncbi:MAG: hypothetical protein JWL90_4212 [Chthoniobacteraceae bacterium]|nr:hypothetical protein [Chthoniobacteraceae bacterium]